MTFARTHQSLIAWMLYGFILFSGLVCSLSHGQMLRAFNHPGLDDQLCGEMRSASGHTQAAHAGSPPLDMASMSEHAQLMKLSMADCAFAGTLALALVAFVGLGWRTGATRKRLLRSDHLLRKPPRYSLPGLAPQAP